MADSILDQAAGALMDKGILGPVDCAFILGTGLGKLAEDIEDAITVPYAEIPGFPLSLVSGHAGNVIYGRLEKRSVLIFQGRAHYYETGDPAAMRVPIGILGALGSPPLFLTNAAGAVKQHLRPGTLVAITDHINLNGPNPLIGESGDARFVSMVEAYDTRLRLKLKRAATHAGVTMNEGVYMWFTGPSFETPAEVKMARSLGADLVGMSTVPEVILARRYRLKVVAVSIVTNLAAGVEGAAPGHAAGREAAAAASATLRRVIRSFVTIMDHALDHG